MNQKLIFTNQVIETLDSEVAAIGAPRTFVLVDTNTAHFVLPVLQSQSEAVGAATIITIPSGDVNKGLESVQTVWRALTDAGASRRDVLVNVGGGVVTDLGGFAAATYKRGMRFINVPTTLLGAVDAAVGGKTGINFGGLKNQVGVFREADAVIISTFFFPTLTQEELLSGYAEMIKHAMLTGPEVFARVMQFSVVAQTYDPDALLALLEESVNVKKSIVEVDPTEKGLRKTLNFGHTAGHAIEAFAMKHKCPVPHGYAVAWGMVIESILSNLDEGFPSETLHQLAAYVREHYHAYGITCDEYDALIDIMRQDKKNASPDAINFTLLRALGDAVIDVTVSPDRIKGALDIYRDLMGLA